MDGMYKVVKVNNVEERNLLAQILFEMGCRWDATRETLSEKPISSITNKLPILIFIYDTNLLTYSDKCDSYTSIDFNVYHEGLIIKEKLKEFLS